MRFNEFWLEAHPFFKLFVYICVAAFIIGFFIGVIKLIKQLYSDTPAEPEQMFDSIVSQGEPQ